MIATWLNNTGTSKIPKSSLLWYFMKRIILWRWFEGYKAVIQRDNASPHTDQTFEKSATDYCQNHVNKQIWMDLPARNLACGYVFAFHIARLVIEYDGFLHGVDYHCDICNNFVNMDEGFQPKKEREMWKIQWLVMKDSLER